MRVPFVMLIALVSLLQIMRAVIPQAAHRGSVATLLTETDPPEGFSYADRPRVFSFPADHGAHSSYRSEWWYFTGNTASDTGQEFGFQFTLFRFALAPDSIKGPSPWRGQNIYLAHFAISDVVAQKFHSFERQNREALDFAGTQNVPFKGWVGDWRMELVNESANDWRITAREGDVALYINLDSRGPIVLQGDSGLSVKSLKPGNASYYYSLPQLAVTGEIKTTSGKHQITGNGWFDHEWSTSALDNGQVGWDWFSLQLTDGSIIMFYQIRLATGVADPATHGVLIDNDGRRFDLEPQDLILTVKNRWRSSGTGVAYPARWRVRVPSHKIDLDIVPKLAAQEWRKSFIYWEGAVRVTGTTAGTDTNGHGYVELVGYD